jgi:hypothetical protein
MVQKKRGVALRPLAGDLLIFCLLWNIGIGLPKRFWQDHYLRSFRLGIKEGLGKSFGKAKGFIYFYCGNDGWSIDELVGVNTMKALYYAAVVNG